MTLSICERIKGFLFSPSDTFDDSKEDTISDAFKYFLVILLIPAVLTAIIGGAVSSLFVGILGAFGAPVAPLLGAVIGPLLALVLFIMVLVGGILDAFIGGLWAHLWVYLLGGRNGVGETIKAVMYGATPGCIFGWIPLLGIIGVIWSIIVVIIGIRQLHDLSTGKAALAVVLAVLIPAIIWAVVIATFIATLPTGLEPGLRPGHPMIRP